MATVCVSKESTATTAPQDAQNRPAPTSSVPQAAQQAIEDSVRRRPCSMLDAQPDARTRDACALGLVLHFTLPQAGCRGRKMRLNPEVVGTPGLDRCFNLLLVEPLEVLFRQGRKLGIRSKP